MSGEKTVSIRTVSNSFRVSPEFKQLLVLAAEREHRRQTNFSEMLLYAHCKERGIEGGSETGYVTS
jgi:hypothetical protein